MKKQVIIGVILAIIAILAFAWYCRTNRVETKVENQIKRNEKESETRARKRVDAYTSTQLDSAYEAARARHK